MVELPVRIAIGNTIPLLEATRQGIRRFLVLIIITRVALGKRNPEEILFTEILITLLSCLSEAVPDIAIDIASFVLP